MGDSSESLAEAAGNYSEPRVSICFGPDPDPNVGGFLIFIFLVGVVALLALLGTYQSVKCYMKQLNEIQNMRTEAQITGDRRASSTAQSTARIGQTSQQSPLVSPHTCQIVNLGQSNSHTTYQTPPRIPSPDLPPPYEEVVHYTLGRDGTVLSHFLDKYSNVSDPPSYSSLDLRMSSNDNSIARV